MLFQLVGGHPALDLVNTLDWRYGSKGAEELLKTYDDLLHFTQQTELLSAAQLRHIRRPPASSVENALVEARELREAIADVFYARMDEQSPSAASREKLELQFNAARLRQTLNWKRAPHLAWEWPASATDALLPVWVLAASAMDLMTSDAVDRVRACDNPECRWLFLDTSKNHTRRWCEMRLCGNRIKARRFKAHKRN